MRRGSAHAHDGAESISHDLSTVSEALTDATQLNFLGTVNTEPIFGGSQSENIVILSHHIDHIQSLFEMSYPGKLQTLLSGIPSSHS